MQPCTQQDRIENIERALFGNMKTNEPGILELIKDTQKIAKETKVAVNDMRLAYRLVKDAGIFADVSMKVARWIIFMIVLFSSIFGAVYAIKEWIKK